MTPQAVIYDDVCKVQDYFDAVALGQEKPPLVVTASDVQRATDHEAAGGITTFAFESDPKLRLVRRVLTDNWSKLPEKLPKASRITLRVKWAEKAGVRRV